MMISIGESVDMGVVDQGMVSISPGKLLSPDAEMIVGNEWRRLVLRGVGKDEGRHMGQHDGGTGNNEEDFLPFLPVVISVGSRHLPHLGPVGLSQQTQSASNQRHD